MPTRHKSFSYFLDPEGKVLLRSTFTVESGQIEKFALQLEIDQQIVLRFDNSHGYVHQHLFLEEGQSQTRELKFTDNQQAYEYCYQYLKTNWASFLDKPRRKDDQ